MQRAIQASVNKVNSALSIKFAKKSYLCIFLFVENNIVLLSLFLGLKVCFLSLKFESFYFWSNHFTFDPSNLKVFLLVPKFRITICLM